MKLDKAIEILTRWQDGKDITSFDDVNTAVKLGIEAMSYIVQSRRGEFIDIEKLLPGETEE